MRRRRVGRERLRTEVRVTWCCPMGFETPNLKSEHARTRARTRARADTHTHTHTDFHPAAWLAAPAVIARAAAPRVEQNSNSVCLRESGPRSGVASRFRVRQSQPGPARAARHRRRGHGWRRSDRGRGRLRSQSSRGRSEPPHLSVVLTPDGRRVKSLPCLPGPFSISALQPHEFPGKMHSIAWK